jgi:hypothetical protein
LLFAARLEYDLAVRKIKFIVCCLLIVFALTPIMAETIEATAPASREAGLAANFLTEFDITFWQTMPFAALWSSFIAGQLTPGGAVNWGHVAYVSIAVSAVNAVLHAKKTTAAHSP